MWDLAPLLDSHRFAFLWMYASKHLFRHQKCWTGGSVGLQCHSVAAIWGLSVGYRWFMRGLLPLKHWRTHHSGNDTGLTWYSKDPHIQPVTIHNPPYHCSIPSLLEMFRPKIVIQGVPKLFWGEWFPEFNSVAFEKCFASNCFYDFYSYLQRFGCAR